MDGVLEVQHAQAVARRAGRVGQHQVARHEVAVDVDGGHRQVVLHDQPEAAFQPLLQPALDRHAAMPPDVPLGKERELALEQRAVAGRQHAGSGRQLPADQLVDRGLVERQRRRGVGRVDGVEHRAPAQVVEQQEAVLAIPVEHPRCAHVGVVQELRDAHEGLAVLLRRRGVHHDAGRRGGGGVDAEIAAEAGIGRGHADRAGDEVVGRRDTRQPGSEGGFARRVGPGHGGGRGDGIGGGHGGGPCDGGAAGGRGRGCGHG